MSLETNYSDYVCPVDLNLEIDLHPMFNIHSSEDSQLLVTQLEVSKGEVVLDKVVELMRKYNIHSSFEVPLISLVLDSIKFQVDREKVSLVESGLELDLVQVSENLQQVYDQNSLFKRQVELNEQETFQLEFETLLQSTLGKKVWLPLVVRLELDYSCSLQKLESSWVEQERTVLQHQSQTIETSYHLDELSTNDLLNTFQEDLKGMKLMAEKDHQDLETQQKQEYHKFILELSRRFVELQHQLKGELKGLTKEGKFKLVEQLPNQIASSFATVTPTLSKLCGLNNKPNQLKEAGVKPLVQVEPDVRQIMDMGFSQTEAEAALKLTEANLGRALDLLLERKGEVDSYIQRLNQIQAKQKLPRQSTSANVPPLQRNNSTNLSQTLHNFQLQSKKKLFNLGKNLGLDELLKDTNQLNLTLNTPSPVEKTSLKQTRLPRYSLLLGSPIKRNYQLHLTRLETFKKETYRLDSPQTLQYLAQCKQSCIDNLYFNKLHALVVFVPITALPTYHLGTSANQELFELCKLNQEFHFEPLQRQLDTILNYRFERPLEEGDYFLTKHSNLTDCQLIFHLLVNVPTTTTPSTEPHKNNPWIGLKSILSSCDGYHIQSLTIPLPATPTSNHHSSSTSTPERRDIPWKNSVKDKLQAKHLETVLKTIKATLNELGRFPHLQTHLTQIQLALQTTSKSYQNLVEQSVQNLFL